MIRRVDDGLTFSVPYEPGGDPTIYQEQSFDPCGISSTNMLVPIGDTVSTKGGIKTGAEYSGGKSGVNGQ